MKDLFVSFELAVKLKEKGFNEECFTWYNKDKHLNMSRIDTLFLITNKSLKDNYKDDWTSAPIYQQVEEWLDSVHKMHFKLFGWEETGFDCYLFKNDSFIGYSVKCKSVTEAKKKAIEKLIELL